MCCYRFIKILLKSPPERPPEARNGPISEKIEKITPFLENLPYFLESPNRLLIRTTYAITGRSKSYEPLRIELNTNDIAWVVPTF